MSDYTTLNQLRLVAGLGPITLHFTSLRPYPGNEETRLLDGHLMRAAKPYLNFPKVPEKAPRK